MRGTRQDYGEVFSVARRNARVRNIPFLLTRAGFDILVDEAEGRCRVSLVEFDFSPRTHGQRRPFKASLDRIDNAKGYSLDNCRLVCALVNIAMNEWGLEPLMKLAFSLVESADWIEEQQDLALLAASDTPPRRTETPRYQQSQLFAEAV